MSEFYCPVCGNHYRFPFDKWEAATPTQLANATARNETSFSLYMNQSKKNLTTRIGPTILTLSANKGGPNV